MTPLTDSENELATALQLAVERGELSLLYQPKIAFESGSVVGVEALTRWEHPTSGTIDPSTFIPLAERAGIIDSLTDWVVGTALKQWVSWREQGVTMSIAVNISALTLRDVDFPDALQRRCQVEGVPCEQVTVELTESATQHVVRLLDTLTRFRLKGVSVALDDFGTGYSSLLQLRQLPFTELKIDQCFVEDLASAEESRLVVKSVIDLAHALGLIAVAEGVESLEALELLARMGCDQVQGYFIARPMQGAELVPWMLQTSERWRAYQAGRKSTAS
jgi:EAL domain-containing protein (putative c-di-GMP-specific phosphodiesterase class I)